MKHTNSKKYCTNYMPIQNSYVSAYYDKMSPIISKTHECKNCVYYTSRNCTSNNKKNYDSVDLIC